MIFNLSKEGRMTTTSSARPLRLTGLAWCLRSFLWIPVLSVVGLAAAAMLVFAQPGVYAAEALVVTRQLDPSAQVLPRYASSVFHSGEVARRVATDLGIADPSELVPDRLDVITPEDSILVTVVGRDADPNIAAQLADAGAAVFVNELNRGGPGIGTFSVQNRATVPSEATQELPPLLAASLGGLVGVALGLGLVLLIAVLRRPVVAAEDVRAGLGTRLIGDLALLPQQPRRFVHPREVPGVAPVARQLGVIPSGRFLFVSDPHETPLRQQVLVTLGVALSGLRPTRLLGRPHLTEEMRSLLGEPMRPVTTDGGPVVLVDQDEPFGLLQQAEIPLLVVVVARKGVPAARLCAATAGYLRSELLGVVLVDGRRRVGRRTPVEQATPTTLIGESVAERIPV